MKIGYIRVSTEEQNTARQEVLLRELGVDEVFIDKASGKNADRPELTRMMNYVRRGDTVIVESISRFARNTRDLLDLVERLTRNRWNSSAAKRLSTRLRLPANSCSLSLQQSRSLNVSISCSVSVRASRLPKSKASTPAANRCLCRITSSGWLLAGGQEKSPLRKPCGRQGSSLIPFTEDAPRFLLHLNISKCE